MLYSSNEELQSKRDVKIILSPLETYHLSIGQDTQAIYLVAQTLFLNISEICNVHVSFCVTCVTSIQALVGC